MFKYIVSLFLLLFVSCGESKSDESSEPSPKNPLKPVTIVKPTPPVKPVEPTKPTELTKPVAPKCEDIKFEIQFTDGPYVSKLSDVKVKFSSLTDVVFGTIYPYMDVHGHGAGMNRSQLYKSATEENVYHLDDFNLIMPGVWQIKVEYQYKKLQCLHSFDFEV